MGETKNSIIIDRAQPRTIFGRPAPLTAKPSTGDLHDSENLQCPFRKKEEFVPLTGESQYVRLRPDRLRPFPHRPRQNLYRLRCRRALSALLGYDVLYVQNITDVGHMLDTGEDRILKKARQLSAGPMQVVETYMRGYFDDMDALGVQRPDISPRASGHIPEQIAMVASAHRQRSCL